MKVMACLLMAWPLFANAQPAAVLKKTVVGEAAPIRTITDEAFQKWVKEDNKLIDGILLSLTHIDTLVSEVERMLKKLPDFGVTPPPVAAMPAPPPPAPVVVEKTAVQEVPASSTEIGDWIPQLAGAGLLALLAFWLGRRQGTALGAGSAKAATPQPKAQKSLSDFELKLEKRASAPPPIAPVSLSPAAPPSAKAAEIAPTAKPISLSPPSVQEQPAAEPLEAIPSISIEQTSRDQGEQALELAEIMLSMGLGHGATQTLAEQIRTEPKQALRHWLKLLDIYRKNGQQEEFERSAEELRLHFNVRPEDWHVQPGTSQTLESFPHIAKRLTELWGKPDCLVYMQNLLDDNRGGARSGFPQAVAEELLMLTALMREAFGLPLA